MDIFIHQEKSGSNKMKKYITNNTTKYKLRFLYLYFLYLYFDIYASFLTRRFTCSVCSVLRLSMKISEICFYFHLSFLENIEHYWICICIKFQLLRLC